MPHTDREEGETWTYALTSQGDINMEGNTAQTVHGEEAHEQDFKVALGTYKGTDPRDEEFGLHVFATFESLQALKREIRKTLEYDDYRHNRIGSVQSIRLTGHEDGSRQNINVHVVVTMAAVNEDIELVFDLFSGQLNTALPPGTWEYSA